MLNSQNSNCLYAVKKLLRGATQNAISRVNPEILYPFDQSFSSSEFLEGDFLVKKQGDQYQCGNCGLVVVVQDPCGCEDTCELICCGEPMEQVKAPAKKAAAKKA
jgi:hypothetical protein